MQGLWFGSSACVGLTRVLAVAGAALAIAVPLKSPEASSRIADRLFGAFSAAMSATAVPLETAVDLNDGRSPVSGRWRDSMARFSRSDAEHMPSAGGIVFVGSSSISLWDDLEAQFQQMPVVKRGLGGARMSDVVHHLDRLALPYRPRLVVVYAGDNDLAEGVPPREILSSYADLVGRLHSALPQTRIAFMSIKPSPAREGLMPLARETNALIAAYSRQDPQLDYIDVHSGMLDASGRVRPELFQADGLHPNARGYAVWKAALADHLR